MGRSKKKVTEKTHAKQELVSGVVKVFTRSHLIECSALGLKWDFNRQLSEEVAGLPEANYPVTFTMFHHHRRMRPCETHIRCGVQGENDLFLFVDVPVEYYRRLPVLRKRMSRAFAQRVLPRSV